MNYYNENDPKAAAWLRELIKRELIAPGVVDTRSITEVRADDLRDFNQCHFFAGIGGWSLALRLAGVPDDFPVWTGSCPCQPFSCAGKRKGTKDKRHLWPVFKKLIAQRKPAIVFGEQVARKAGGNWYAGVRADLEKLGYQNAAADLCAAGVGAPHIRQRIYWMAHRISSERTRRGEEKREAEFPFHVANGGEFRGMGNAESDNEQRHSIPGTYRQGKPPGRSGRAGWLDIAGRVRCDPRIAGDGGGQDCTRRESGMVASGSGSTCRMDNAAGHGAGCGHEAEPRGDWPEIGLFRQAGSWSNFDIIVCRDVDKHGRNKTRRVESGTFPLADGVPARVVRLRGYGNAIVPELAAQFIAAGFEVMNDL